MYNSEQPPPTPAARQQLMAPPRMSFSSDFALEPPPPRPPGRADADFEFSPAGSRPSMMDADQLFSKGRILPLRESTTAPRPPTTTLRDELQLRAPDAGGRRGPATRWKELLGLKSRAHAHKKGAAAASAADAHVDLGGEHGEAAEARE